MKTLNLWCTTSMLSFLSTLALLDFQVILLLVWGLNFLVSTFQAKLTRLVYEASHPHIICAAQSMI